MATALSFTHPASRCMFTVVWCFWWIPIWCQMSFMCSILEIVLFRWTTQVGVCCHSSTVPRFVFSFQKRGFCLWISEKDLLLNQCKGYGVGYIYSKRFYQQDIVSPLSRMISVQSCKNGILQSMCIWNDICKIVSFSLLNEFSMEQYRLNSTWWFLVDILHKWLRIRLCLFTDFSASSG